MSETRSSEPLVLSALSSTATIQPGDLALALWVLSTRTRRSRSCSPRRWCSDVGWPAPVWCSPPTGGAWSLKSRANPFQSPRRWAWRQSVRRWPLNSSTSRRQIGCESCPGSRAREPPVPDYSGRRYYWIDGLGAASGYEQRECFDRHSDQCLFEAVDNVHRWSRAGRSLAVVSATAGGGHESHNRLQIVVVDDGVGIVSSVREKAAALAARGERTACLSNSAKTDSEIAVDVVSDPSRGRLW